MKSITKLIVCASLFALISCGVEAQSETTVIATGTTFTPEVSVLGIVETIPETITTEAPTTTASTTTAPTTVKKTTTTTVKPKPATTTTQPTTTVVEKEYVGGGIESVIRSAAAEFGVSGDRMVRVARCESTLNPSAKNGKYGGLYQFSDQTWVWFAGMSGIGGSKWDASSAARMAAWAFANGYASHWECK